MLALSPITLLLTLGLQLPLVTAVPATATRDLLPESIAFDSAADVFDEPPDLSANLEARATFPRIRYCLDINWGGDCFNVGGPTSTLNTCYNTKEERQNKISSIMLTEPRTVCQFFDYRDCTGPSFLQIFGHPIARLDQTNPNWNDRIESWTCGSCYDC